MKKILSLMAVLVLAGCANTGPNQAIGTGVGAVGGYAVGRALGGGAAGSAVGAVAGAVVGGAVGQSMDQQQSQQVIVRQAPPVYVERPHRSVRVCRVERDWDPYYRRYVGVERCFVEYR
jgi:osmotically inducible lipoprotein OsmB